MSSSTGESGQGEGADRGADLPVPRTSELEAGTLVNGIYRLVRLVGMGGMGEVWEARHERTKGRVALKLLLPEMGRHPDVLLRFQREVEITSALNHPNIVRVSDADKLPNGRPFLVMEFLDGKDLTSLTGRPMMVGEVAEIIEQTAMGLHAAHERSVIHRDLKPANLFVVPLPGTSRSLVKILDFGISKALDGLSKLTQTHSVIGTPYYMAPEQARGGIASMDGRADQFSLAAIAYELLTGKMAFAGDGTLNVLYKVVLEAPPTFAAAGIAAGAGVEAVVMRGLSKSADDRYATVLGFSDALKAAAGVGTPQGRATGKGPARATDSAGRQDASVASGAPATPAGFAAAGDTHATRMPGALATPRTLQLPDGPATTLRGSTGEVKLGQDDPRLGGKRVGRDTGGVGSSKRRTLGLVIAGSTLGVIVVAIIALRGSPSTAVNAAGEGAAATGELNRAVPDRAHLPAAVVPVVPPAAPSAAPPVPPPSAAPVVPPRTPPVAPEQDRAAVEPDPVAEKPVVIGKTKSRSTAKASSLGHPDRSRVEKAPSSRTTRQPGPVNDDL